VCEGCGDCSKKSGCLSVLPVETALGRKRKIDQSSCNKDYSCVEGFCPSFVTVEGGKLKKQSGAAATLDSMPALPAPQIPALHDPFSIMITGVGGTGVVTIGQVLGMAAYLDNKGVTVLDMAGLAQKAARCGRTCALPTASSNCMPCALLPVMPTWCWAAIWWSPLPKKPGQDARRLQPRHRQQLRIPTSAFLKNPDASPAAP
jgi:hypothetical protein